MKHNTEELHSLLQRVSSSEDLLELSQSAAAAKQTGATLAARQAKMLESVSQELLCSPEIIRCNLLAAWCICCPQTGALVVQRHLHCPGTMERRLPLL